MKPAKVMPPRGRTAGTWEQYEYSPTTDHPPVMYHVTTEDSPRPGTSVGDYNEATYLWDDPRDAEMWLRYVRMAPEYGHKAKILKVNVEGLPLMWDAYGSGADEAIGHAWRYEGNPKGLKMAGLWESPSQFQIPHSVEEAFIRAMECPHCHSNLLLNAAPPKSREKVYCPVCGWTPRVEKKANMNEDPGFKERWTPGETAYFEYHCNQAHDSSHAQWWYRSRQPVTVISQESDNGATIDERGEGGEPNVYKVRWKDGAEGDVFEDELLTDPQYYDPTNYFCPPPDWKERLGPMETKTADSLQAPAGWPSTSQEMQPGILQVDRDGSAFDDWITARIPALHFPETGTLAMGHPGQSHGDVRRALMNQGYQLPSYGWEHELWDEQPEYDIPAMWKATEYGEGDDQGLPTGGWSHRDAFPLMKQVADVPIYEGLHAVAKTAAAHELDLQALVKQAEQAGTDYAKLYQIAQEIEAQARYYYEKGGDHHFDSDMRNRWFNFLGTSAAMLGHDRVSPVGTAFGDIGSKRDDVFMQLAQAAKGIQDFITRNDLNGYQPGMLQQWIDMQMAKARDPKQWETLYQILLNSPSKPGEQINWSEAMKDPEKAQGHMDAAVMLTLIKLPEYQKLQKAENATEFVARYVQDMQGLIPELHDAEEQFLQTADDLYDDRFVKPQIYVKDSPFEQKPSEWMRFNPPPYQPTTLPDNWSRVSAPAIWQYPLDAEHQAIQEGRCPRCGMTLQWDSNPKFKDDAEISCPRCGWEPETRMAKVARHVDVTIQPSDNVVWGMKGLEAVTPDGKDVAGMVINAYPDRVRVEHVEVAPEVRDTDVFMQLAAGLVNWMQETDNVKPIEMQTIYPGVARLVDRWNKRFPELPKDLQTALYTPEQVLGDPNAEFNLMYGATEFDSPMENPVSYQFVPFTDGEIQTWHDLDESEKARYKRMARNLNSRARARVTGTGNVAGRDLYLLNNRYQGKCAYCGLPGGNETFDHVLPLAQGGMNKVDNLLPCHLVCNKELNEWDKSNRDYIGPSSPQQMSPNWFQQPAEAKVSMAFPGEGWYWHIAPQRFRESIREHGLDYRIQGETSPHGWNTTMSGNYLTRSHGLATTQSLYAGEPCDVWAVNTDGMQLNGDPNDPTWQDPGADYILDPWTEEEEHAKRNEHQAAWVWTPDPIPPERLELWDDSKGDPEFAWMDQPDRQYAKVGAQLLMYHVVPAEDAHSLQEHGIDFTKRDESRDWRHEHDEPWKFPEGNYLTDDLGMAQEYAHGSGGQIYRVDASGLQLFPDPAGDPHWQDPNTEHVHAWYSPDPIGPERIIGPYDPDEHWHLSAMELPSWRKLEPDPELRQVAQSYMDSKRWPYNPPRTYPEVDESRAKRIADEYERMPHAPNDPYVRSAYRALAQETADQYNHLVNNGYTFEFEPPGGAYNSPWDAARDIRDNKHMYVYPTSVGYGMGEKVDEHPLLQDTGYEWNGQPVTYNDLFRGVHDAFGHAKEGVGFRHHGEENAWRQHSAMYSDLARHALTSETRGQNSWVNFGPYGDHNQTANQADTVYPPQKAGLLPEWATWEGAHDHYENTNPWSVLASDDFTQFFEDASHGQYAPHTPYVPTYSNPEHEAFDQNWRGYSGNFDQHIDSSIPGYREQQTRKGVAITKTFGPDAKMIDLGGSEGSFGKAITEQSGMQTTNLDPNDAMEEHFHNTPVPQGAEFVKGYFGEHNPGQIYDVVHESMLFQFIGPEREQHIAEAKRLLKPNGIFLCDEKVTTDNFDQNEAEKDAWKGQFYSPEQLQQKQDVVKVQKAAGMIDNMVHQDDLEQILRKYFHYVKQVWDSGNFVGYAASDDQNTFETYISNLN